MAKSGAPWELRDVFRAVRFACSTLLVSTCCSIFGDAVLLLSRVNSYKDAVLQGGFGRIIDIRGIYLTKQTQFSPHACRLCFRYMHCAFKVLLDYGNIN